MSAFVGALTEAWAELRHHKMRVLLSLVGIALSVAAITGVIAMGEYQKQLTAEMSDRTGGRVATLTVAAHNTDGTALDTAAFDARFERVAERFAFSHTSRIVDGLMLDIQTPQQVRPVTAKLVDQAQPVMHRTPLTEGRWFRDGDERLLAPPVVISEPLWNVYGRPALSGGFTVQLVGAAAGTYTVVGVTPNEFSGDSQKRITLLYDSYTSRVDGLPAEAMTSWEVWVPPEKVAEIGPLLAMDLRAGLQGTEVAVSRSDWGSRPDAVASAAVYEGVSTGIAGLVLLLGGLGLVNIQLVAMRQRIREIGVRRSFGATGGRIFVSVLLESVVATAVAGIVGIAVAIAILRSPLVLNLFPGLQDVPPFPLRAAVTGLAAAVGIGALAGFLPALVAVRAKVIEALRF